ncbi:MAG: alpha-ribazole phosphatase family protein [Crocinitomicaceae bacterium]|nr:alpha-ribazole phosphatase family protein [Crocinitomicaceae bacterium]
MELILIRHTTPAIEKGICYGQSDLNVADSFEAELELILKEVGQHRKVYSSPLKRCRILAERLGTDVIYDDRILEMDFGDWELKPWNDIPLEDIQPWFDDYVNVPAKNGESLFDLKQRVELFLEEILFNSNVETAVIVTHAGVIRVLNGLANRISMKSIFNLKLNYGEVLRVNIHKITS